MLLRNHTFLKLWLGNLFSSLGNIFYEVVIVWYLVTISGSAFVAAGIPLAVLAGSILGSVLIAKRVDLLPTKKLMIVTEGMRTFLLTALLIFQNFFINFVLALYLLQFTLAVLSVIYFIARSKTIPEVVEKESLVSANGLEGVSAGIVRIVAWGLGGYFITHFNLNISIYVALAVSIISFILVTNARWDSVIEDKEDNSQSLKNGIDKINANIVIKKIVYAEILFFFFMGFLWVALPFKINALGSGILYGMQGMIFGLGYLLTSLLLSSKAKLSKVKSIYILGFGFYMVGNLFMPLATSSLVFLIGLFLSGLATSFWSVGRSTLIHSNIETKEVGKVFSVFELGTSIAQIPGFIIGGILVDNFGFSLIMIISVILQFTCLLWVQQIRIADKNN